MNKIETFLSGSTFRSRFFLVQISGFLTWLAFPNVNAHSRLAWFCMAFWLLALRQAGWKERLFHGLVFSLWYSLPEKWGIFWRISSDNFIHWYISFAFFILFFAGYVLPFIIFSGVSPRWPGERIGSILGRCALLTALIAWTPTVFPINPALMVHDQLISIQTADLGGIYLVVFLVLWVNFLLAEMAFLIWRDRRRFGYYSLYLALTILFIVGYGEYRIRERQRMEAKGQGHYAQVAVLETRFLPQEPLASLIRQAPKGGYSAMELTELCAIHFPQASAIVWPELPIYTRPQDGEKLQKKVSDLAARLQKRIIYSSMEIVGDSTPFVEYCTARLILPDGSEGGKYRKSSLIPFFESTPFPNLMWERSSYYRPGTEAAVFRLDEKTTAIPSLCYDLHSARHLREGVRLGGNIIVHMSSFYSFDKSPVPFIDLTMAKFYAVEYRLPIARAANRGYGALIRATGEILDGSLTTPKDRDINSLPLFVPATRSIYFSIGDLFLYLLTAYAVWMISQSWLFRLWRRLRK